MTMVTSPMKPKRHVAVCPFPLASHPATLLLLTQKLGAASPDVHFTFLTTSYAAGALPEFSNVRIHHVGDRNSKGEEVRHPKERLRMFLEGASQNLRRSMAAAEEEVGLKIGFVVADALLSKDCGEIAEEMKVKWVAVWTSGVASLAAHMYTDILRTGIQDGGIEAHKEETADKYIPGFPVIPITELPYDVIFADLSSPGGRLLHLMSLTIPKAAAVAVNSSIHLETTISATLNSIFSHNLLHVGPFPLTLSSQDDDEKDDHDCLPWLDRHLSTTGPASVAYISFGTANAPPAEELIALAKALKVTDVPFLWSLPDDNYSIREIITSGWGKVVSWAPQMKVLRHEAVGAHVTHCGWNSIMESIVTGVPMVCRPFMFAEQMLNKELVESVWRIGVEVEGGKLTEDGAASAVEKVVSGVEGRRMRERIREMKRMAKEDAAQSSAQDFGRLLSIVTE